MYVCIVFSNVSLGLVCRAVMSSDESQVSYRSKATVVKVNHKDEDGVDNQQNAFMGVPHSQS